MKLSIVATLYLSAPYLQEFYTRISREAKRITLDYELILVNDGSPDDSLELAIALHEEDPRVIVIDLSRNFGHHKAMMTGMSHARGERVFLIDCDLEEDPELLGEFHTAFDGNESDVVYGVQDSRKGGLFERASGRLFYLLFNLLSGQVIPSDVAVVRMMSRRYVRSLVAHRESELLIAGLWQNTGFRQDPFSIHKRSKSGSTYNLRRKMGLLVRGITSFSNKPLIYIAYLGFGMLALSSLYIIYRVLVLLFAGHPPEGYTSLIVSVWFVGGLVIFSLGIIAIYLSVVFVETKNRPYTIIREIYGGQDAER